VESSRVVHGPRSRSSTLGGGQIPALHGIRILRDPTRAFPDLPEGDNFDAVVDRKAHSLS